MKRILILLFLLSIAGCGSTLHELKNSNPEKIEVIKKEAICIYGKLNSSAIINNHPSPNLPLIWQSNWDSIIKQGIILGTINDIASYFPILFNIQGYDNVTKIEIRVDNKSGIRKNHYQQLALKILSSADFSSCPDL